MLARRFSRMNETPVRYGRWAHFRRDSPFNLTKLAEILREHMEAAYGKCLGGRCTDATAAMMATLPGITTPWAGFVQAGNESHSGDHMAPNVLGHLLDVTADQFPGVEYGPVEIIHPDDLKPNEHGQHEYDLRHHRHWGPDVSPWTPTQIADMLASDKKLRRVHLGTADDLKGSRLLDELMQGIYD
jgi:hypothetical protein